MCHSAGNQKGKAAIGDFFFFFSFLAVDWALGHSLFILLFFFSPQFVSKSILGSL
jgi:hypothetical protein